MDEDSLIKFVTPYCIFSGLPVNDEMTEIFAIGLQCLDQEVHLHKIRNMVNELI